MTEQLEAPIYKKVDPKDCTHVGYYVPMGYEAFHNKDNSYTVISGKMCIRCGTEFDAASTIGRSISGKN